MVLPAFLSPVRLLNTLALAEQVRCTPDISFGPHRLDIYAPRRLDRELPVVVLFHGGGWDSGDTVTYRFAASALAARGFVVVVPGYRVFPEVRFPAFLEDGAAAVRWTTDNVAGHGGDARRLVLAGHSAGAHIAAMLAMDRQWLDGVGLDADSDVRGIVGLAGPYDFLPLHSAHLSDIFGPEAGLAATQPINFVDRRVVPAFLAAGARDTVVDPANSVRLAARIRQFGGRARLRIYRRASHETLIGAFSPALRWIAPVLADTAAFVADVTAEAAPALETLAAEPVTSHSRSSSA